MKIESFLEKRGLVLVSKISKGYSAEIFLVKNRRGKAFALKMEKQKSRRIEMVRKEAEFLKLANSLGVGPRLIDFDLKAKCILMEHIAGERFCDWIRKTNSKRGLNIFLQDIVRQLRKLDSIGLSHGQLGGSGKNILVRKSRPVIIDFEKASTQRKAKNVSQFFGEFVFNPHSAIAKKISKLLGKKSAVSLLKQKFKA